MIDLRSDTVTRPTPGMRAAMAAAPVGDDQFGEDPTVNELQARIAALLGKEAALWLPSGTMANQVALRALTRPGDDVIVSRESHAVWHETGGGAANAGVQFTEIGQGGRFTAADFAAAVKPRDHMLYPPTTLVEVENTHNRAGGIVIDQDEAIGICAAARERRITSFLDGARLWNAAAASGRSLADLAAPFDVATVALSKGLGAPAGTMLAGSRDVIRELRASPADVWRGDAAGRHPRGRRHLRARSSPRPAGRRSRQREADFRAAGREPARRARRAQPCRPTS